MRDGAQRRAGSDFGCVDYRASSFEKQDPSCGKAGIRLVAFTDAAGVLHMIGVGPKLANQPNEKDNDNGSYDGHQNARGMKVGPFRWPGEKTRN